MASTLNNSRYAPYKRAFECRWCGECLKNRASLRRHLYLHPECPNRCHECCEAFEYGYMLKAHSLRHTDPSIPCPVCPETFKNQALLTKHLVRKHNSVNIPEEVEVPKKQIPETSQEQPLTIYMMASGSTMEQSKLDEADLLLPEVDSLVESLDLTHFAPPVWNAKVLEDFFRDL